jgi:hypothetical protein
MIAVIGRLVEYGDRLRNEIEVINNSGGTVQTVDIDLAGDVIHLGEIPDGEAFPIRVAPGSREFFSVRVRLWNGEESKQTWGDEEAGRMWGRRWQVVILPDRSIRIVGMGLRSTR